MLVTSGREMTSNVVSRREVVSMGYRRTPQIRRARSGRLRRPTGFRRKRHHSRLFVGSSDVVGNAQEDVTHEVVARKRCRRPVP